MKKIFLLKFGLIFCIFNFHIKVFAIKKIILQDKNCTLRAIPVGKYKVEEKKGSLINYECNVGDLELKCTVNEQSEKNSITDNIDYKIIEKGSKYIIAENNKLGMKFKIDLKIHSYEFFETFRVGSLKIDKNCNGTVRVGK